MFNDDVISMCPEKCLDLSFLSGDFGSALVFLFNKSIVSVHARAGAQHVVAPSGSGWMSHSRRVAPCARLQGAWQLSLYCGLEVMQSLTSIELLDKVVVRPFQTWQIAKLAFQRAAFVRLSINLAKTDLSMAAGLASPGLVSAFFVMVVFLTACAVTFLVVSGQQTTASRQQAGNRLLDLDVCGSIQHN